MKTYRCVTDNDAILVTYGETKNIKINVVKNLPKMKIKITMNKFNKKNLYKSLKRVFKKCLNSF